MSRKPLKKSCVRCGQPRPASVVRPTEKYGDKGGVCYVCEPLPGTDSASWQQKSDDIFARRRCSQCGVEADKLRKGMCDKCKPPKASRISWKAQGLFLTPKGPTITKEGAERYRQMAAGFANLNEFFATSSIVPRCTCCYAPHAGLDSNGNPWCAACAASVFQCGRCIVHDSQVFFAQLTENPAPEVTPEPVIYRGDESLLDCDEPA